MSVSEMFPKDEMTEDQLMAREKRKVFYADRKKAGESIDPETCEMHWTYAQTLDPYGINPDLPEECDQVGRVYFVSSDASGGWIHLGDLSEAKREAVWARMEREQKEAAASRDGLKWADDKAYFFSPST